METDSRAEKTMKKVSDRKYNFYLAELQRVGEKIYKENLEPVVLRMRRSFSLAYRGFFFLSFIVIDVKYIRGLYSLNHWFVPSYERSS